MNEELLNQELERFASVVGEHMKAAETVAPDFIPIACPQLTAAGLKNIMDAYASTWVSSLGKYIGAFEAEFAAYCGMQYAVSTSNGTTALHLALAALGIGPGDEVIVPDSTFAATINSVLYVGATPVIVDICEDSWCIDPAEIRKAITDKTRAVIPVHLYGQPCDMAEIMSIAKEHNLYVIEDCAEAHGAEFDGKRVGSFGDISCFSFFGNKIITTGEGGMCLTNSAELNDKMRVLRDHGMSKQYKYYHEHVGFNYRMTNLQAALGVAQLSEINERLTWRAELEETYRRELADIPGLHFQRNDLPRCKRVTWLITAYLDDAEKREALMQAMRDAKIDARPFFVPLSKMEIYQKYARPCKVSAEMSKLGFNLPTSHLIGEKEIQRVAAVIKKVL